MKQKELLVIGLTACIAAVISFIVSGMIFGSPKKHPIKVPVVTPISSSFPSVTTDDNYKSIFNDKAINPTQLIQIGGNNNTTPFNGTSPQ